MTKRKREPKRTRPEFAFDPVPVRPRHDGWTPRRQIDFIEALAECGGCVEEACDRVGMSSQSANALRRRVDAQSFRLAWEMAGDYAVRRLSDAAFSRSLKGVTRPIFYQGKQIGERRFFDERLTMFLQRYRDPKRYGAWLDKYAVEQHPDGPALQLARAIDRLALDAYAMEAGKPPRKHPPMESTRIVSDDELEERRQRREAAAERRAERAREAEEDAEDEQFWRDQESAKMPPPPADG
jgi:hypothetical protein